LRAVGVDVVGIAAIAATRRQGLARRGLHKTGFADYGSWQPNRGEEAAWTSS
jgi:hypothetical protein